MKITDAKLLHEIYDVEADWKLLIGHRFKGCLPGARQGDGHLSAVQRGLAASPKAKKRARSKRS